MPGCRSLADRAHQPVNVVQQVGTNLTMVLICQQLGYPQLSITRIVVFGLILIWVERVATQLILYSGQPPKDRPYRVYFDHSGRLADTRHWLLQLEHTQYEVFKENGGVTAELVTKHMTRSRPNRPWQKSLYIPFFQ